MEAGVTVADLVRARLLALGYTVTDKDAMSLEMAVLRAECRLKAETNLPEVPGGLLYVWVDMAAGELLSERHAAGGLAEYDLAPSIKSITEGDISLTYTSSDAQSAEARFGALLTKLMTPPESMLAYFRRVKW